jgi:hypothetical protein
MSRLVTLYLLPMAGKTYASHPWPACLFMCHIMLKPSSSWLSNLWMEIAQILCSGLIDGWLEKIEELAHNPLKTISMRVVKQ